MATFIISIIYLSFVGLGSSDALFGSSWPTMQQEMGVPISYAGIVTMVISLGTIIASLLSARIVKKIGIRLTATFAVFTSALVLLGFSYTSSFWVLCFLAFPLGFAGGSIDASMNNYVAMNYTSRAMNWLHSFWGLGAVISPLIMGFALTRGQGWNSGYQVVFFIQMSIAVLFFVSAPIWKKQASQTEEEVTQKALRLPEVLRIKGVKYVLFAFFAYCAVEATAGLWASTYLVKHRGVDTATAASYASFFFIGVTIGRFISGFIANKIGDKNMIRIGISIAILGIVAVALPISSTSLALYGLIVIGLGCAPIFPAIIHSTPIRFGHNISGSIIGVQMASAYLGSSLMPPLFGLLATYVDVALYPFFLLIFASLVLIMTESVNRLIKISKVKLTNPRRTRL